MEANDGPFECSEYYRFLILVKLKTSLMKSPWNKKYSHNFVGYFNVLPDNFGASARNKEWNLSFEEGKKLQRRQ